MRVWIIILQRPDSQVFHFWCRAVCVRFQTVPLERKNLVSVKSQTEVIGLNFSSHATGVLCENLFKFQMWDRRVLE